MDDIGGPSVLASHGHGVCKRFTRCIRGVFAGLNWGSL